jgi:signal transduction histidine kinase
MRVLKIVLVCVFFTTYSFAQNPLPSLLTRLSLVAQDTNRVQLLESIADYYENIKPDSATFYTNDALILSERLNYTYGIANANRLLGEQDLDHGRMADAKIRFEKALPLFEKIRNLKGISGVNNALGVWSAKQGNYEDATQSFLKALSINEQMNDTTGIVQAYIKLGSVNLQNGDLDKALECYTKGNALVKNRPASDETGTLLNDIGNVYASKKDPTTSLKYYLEGLSKITDPQLNEVRILLLGNAGGTYHDLGNNALAYRYDKEALTLIRQTGLKESEIVVLVNIATLLRDTKPDSSAILLNQAFKIASDIHQNYLILGVYQAMVDLDKQKGDYKEAEQLLEKRNLLQDSLFTIKKAEDISALQSNYRLAQQKVKLQNLQLINQKFKFHQILLIGIIVTVVLLLIVVFIFYIRTGYINKVLVESQNELKKQKEELYKSNTFKDKLFSIIGHDLRSPVAGVVGMLRLVEDDGVLAEDLKAFVPQLKEQSEATLDILDKLLMWGKSQLTGITNNRSVFNVKELIIKNIILYKNAALQKGISLVDRSSEGIPIYADITHVDFVIRNIVANAIKYTNIGGEIEIGAVADRITGYTTIFIKDNGIGISKELQQQIFEPGNKSMDGTQKEKGNGIGLMLCKEFAEDNDGKIEIQSEIGQGTQFLISFPLPEAYIQSQDGGA